MIVENIKEIERKNRNGYDLIAPEFSDELRVTTANFHDVSRAFFERAILTCRGDSGISLDLGTGRGPLLTLLHSTMRRVVAMDLSMQMLELHDTMGLGTAKVCSSAFNLPIADETVSLVTAGLADPFLRPEALWEIKRVLKEGGRFAFSSPSHTWASALRNQEAIQQSTTRFRHSSGEEAEVYSFTYRDEDLQYLLKSCGFHVEIFKVIWAQALREHRRVISAALSKAAARLQIDLERLPILQCVLARKGGY